MAALAAVTGCKKAEPTAGSAAAPAAAPPAIAAPPAPAAAMPAPPDARPVMAKLDPPSWGSQGDAKLDASPAAGPFPSLDAVCAAFRTSTDDTCEHEPLDAAHPPAAPFLEVARVITFSEAPGADPNDPRSAWSEVSVAIRTAAGWFVLPRVGYQANYTTWDGQLELVGPRLVIRYASSEATEGRWASDDETGLIACGASSAGAVACTARIVATSVSSSTEDREAPQGKTVAHLACAVAFTVGDHLLLTDLPKGHEGPRAAKGTCAQAPLWGDHVVPFAP